LDFAFATAGNNIAARIAMMAITTSNSINVNARRDFKMLRISQYDGKSGESFNSFTLRRKKNARVNWSSVQRAAGPTPKPAMLERSD
jgi:hypothetical protein